jgi:hypothetical protein
LRQGKETGYGTVQPLLKAGKVEMAQKVTVELEDDLTGGPAEQTVRFAYEGSDYEIDLSAKNAAAFGKKLAPYLEHARRAGRAPARRPGRTAANRHRSAEIRAWAKEHGLAVSERGRIPAGVAEQYQAAGGR